MTVKSFLYTTFAFICYLLAYPVAALKSVIVSNHSLLIYLIARCEGYPKSIALCLVKQAQLESGNFTSNGFKSASNAFGMKQPRKRPTLSVGTIQLSEGTFARFSSLSTSVLDRIMWDRYFNIKITSNPEKYMNDVISKGYAQDGNYFNKWFDQKPKVDTTLAGPISMFYGTIAVIIILVYKTKNNYA